MKTKLKKIQVFFQYIGMNIMIMFVILERVTNNYLLIGIEIKCIII